MRSIINRLAAYEDTGLEPEEIKRVHETLLTVQEKKSVMWNDLQKYLQAEAEGRLLVLPCKVGTTVYVIKNVVSRGYPDPIIKQVVFEEAFSYEHLYFQKSVFTTYEEAEKALEAQHENL